ncbi:hypothetical protein HGB13_03310 [bacterium]|nr:hypothetical protein [bacterium]
MTIYSTFDSINAFHPFIEKVREYAEVAMSFNDLRRFYNDGRKTMLLELIELYISYKEEDIFDIEITKNMALNALCGKVCIDWLEDVLIEKYACDISEYLDSEAERHKEFGPRREVVLARV